MPGIFCCASDVDLLAAFKERLVELYDLSISACSSNVYLSVDVARLPSGALVLSQAQYTKELLIEFDHKDCRGANVPAAPGQHLTSEDCPKSEEERAEMRKLPYSRFRELLGKLLYLSLSVRPDIAYAVNQAARFAASALK